MSGYLDILCEAVVEPPTVTDVEAALSDSWTTTSVAVVESTPEPATEAAPSGTDPSSCDLCNELLEIAKPKLGAPKKYIPPSSPLFLFGADDGAERRPAGRRLPNDTDTPHRPRNGKCSSSGSTRVGLEFDEDWGQLATYSRDW